MQKRVVPIVKWLNNAITIHCAEKGCRNTWARANNDKSHSRSVKLPSNTYCDCYVFFKIYFSKCIFQNVFFKTYFTKCISLNVFLKMYFSKCISQNVDATLHLVRSICRHQTCLFIRDRFNPFLPETISVRREEKTQLEVPPETSY